MNPEKQVFEAEIETATLLKDEQVLLLTVVEVVDPKIFKSGVTAFA